MATGLLLDRGIRPLDGGIPATRLSASGSSGARAGSQGGDFGRGEGLADSAAGLILLLAIVEVGTAKFEAPVAQKIELSTCKYIMNCRHGLFGYLRATMLKAAFIEGILQHP